MGDRGHIAVEFAMTAPLLVGFLYGILEVSHFGYLRMTVSNVAHDGARYAIVHSAISAQPLVASDIVTHVTNQLSALSLTTTGASAATVTVTYSPNTNPGSTVLVQISYPFIPIMPGFNSIPGSGRTFNSLVGPITALSKMIVSP
jgi:Flp pilus assembly protein TadG